MFDLDASKLIVVGIVALAVIPPKDLPRVLRTVGQYVGKMRRMASEFQGQFMDAMKEAEKAADLESVKKEFASLDESAKFDTSFDVNAALNRESSKPEPIDPAKSIDPAASIDSPASVDKSIDSPKSIAGPEVAAEAEPAAPPGEPFSADVVVKAPQIPEVTPSAESHAPSAP
jgi:sec-independent protein translocase protein TatB